MEWRTWGELTVMSALYMAVWLSCSIIAPFFAPEAIYKGANQTAAGLVFGAFSITSFIVGLPLGSLVPRIGGKRMLIIGAGLCGCTNIIFGLLDLIQDSTLFVTSALVIRIMEALGSSAAMIAAMATVGGKYPEHAPQMLGLLEMFSGLAFMLGPVMGSLLYKVGGYQLPFFTLGGTCLLFAALNAVILPGAEVTYPGSEKPFRLLRIPAVWPVTFTIFVGSASLAVFTVGIAYHTQRIGLLSANEAGFVFFVQGGAYALSTPILGWILNKLMNNFRVAPRVMLIIGSVLSSLSFLMIGPSPWLPFIPSTTFILLLSSALIGLSMGVIAVPSIIDIVTTAEWYGLPKGATIYGLASGLFLSCFHIGSFVGSTLGGALFDWINFERTTSVFAMCHLLSALVVAVTFAWEYQCGKGRRDPRATVSDVSETKARPLAAFKEHGPVEPDEVCELVFYEY